jgi:hypothetical protein
MQHDTSPYRLCLGGTRLAVVASILYFRFSKLRYLKFYRYFNRFIMKCFFYEAVSFFGYVAPKCIIDNTNLARLRGTGRNAVIVPEMERFAAGIGFGFLCHEVKQCNRKAGNERSFYTVETNFFPGRSFESLEDLNRQALEWATVRMANRPVSKTGLIPVQAFEYEKAFLEPMPPYVEPPYLVHTRVTDQYGYVAFQGNYYWVPRVSGEEAKAVKEVKVFEYCCRLKLYWKRKQLAEYDLPPWGVKNRLFHPGGAARPPHRPKNRRRPTAAEEKTLRAVSEDVAAYLDFAVKPKGTAKHRFIRSLYALYRKLAPDVFLQTVQRAFRYRIAEMETVERIALLYLRAAHLGTPSVDIDEAYQHRLAYLEGRLTDEVDLSLYDRLLDDDDE